MRWHWVCSFSRYDDLDGWGRANRPAYQLLNLAATSATYRPGYFVSIPRFFGFLSPALFDSDRRQKSSHGLSVFLAAVRAHLWLQPQDRQRGPDLHFARPVLGHCCRFYSAHMAEAAEHWLQKTAY